MVLELCVGLGLVRAGLSLVGQEAPVPQTWAREQHQGQAQDIWW